MATFKTLTVKLPVDLHKRLKHEALDRETTVGALLAQVLKAHYDLIDSMTPGVTGRSTVEVDKVPQVDKVPEAPGTFVAAPGEGEALDDPDEAWAEVYSVLAGANKGLEDLRPLSDFDPHDPEGTGEEEDGELGDLDLDDNE